MDDFTTDAYEVALHRNGLHATFRESLTTDPITNFLAGAAWARDHLARQEATDAEVEAAAQAIYGVEAHDWPLGGVHPPRNRTWGELHSDDRENFRAIVRAAFTAARSVGRGAR